MLDTNETPDQTVARLIEAQREGNTSFPDAALRKDRLDRTIDLLRQNADAICDAVSADFGHRPAGITKLAGIGQSIAALKHNRRHIDGWMKPEPVKTEAMLAIIGARSKIIRQPKGVIGNIVPWNYPVFLTFTPLAGMLGAGNTVVIKPSEHTPAYADLLAELIGKRFDQTEVTVTTGGTEIGKAMSAAPFDHLFFTGSSAVGKHVMRACADNLTPVTLELGGKSPAIVSKSADIAMAARRVMHSKVFNAGQTCVAADYALVQHDQVDAFIEACKVAVAAMLPTFEVGSDLTSQIHTRQFDRLVELLETSGTEPIHLHPQGKLNRDDRLFPPIALKNPNLNAAVMTEEIFGPILPVIGVENFDHALSIIAKRDHPLALYYFGTDKSEQARIEADTTAGGITINDTILHISQDTLPFGGVGASGIGRYHGKHGFDEFSHIKSVLHASRSRLAELHFPPYRVAMRWLLKTRL